MRAIEAKKEQLAELRRRVAVLGGGPPPEAMQAEVSGAALGRRVRLIDGDAYGETPADLWTRRLLVPSERLVYTAVIGSRGWAGGVRERGEGPAKGLCGFSLLSARAPVS